MHVYNISWPYSSCPDTPRKERRQTYQRPFASSELSSLVSLFLCLLCNYTWLLQNSHMGSLGMGSWLEIFCDKIRRLLSWSSQKLCISVSISLCICVYKRTCKHMHSWFMDTYILFNRPTCQLASIDKSPDIPFYFEASRLTKKSSGQAPMHNETLPKKSNKKNLYLTLNTTFPTLFPRELKFILVIYNNQ